MPLLRHRETTCSNAEVEAGVVMQVLPASTFAVFQPENFFEIVVATPDVLVARDLWHHMFQRPALG